jgi:putative ABC transport system permease protein
MGTRSASLRKSVTDLTRRRARSVLTVLTLAMAVASISFLAIPTLIDRAMQDEVRDGRLADVRITMQPVMLTSEQLATLAALPNVVAVEPRSSIDVRVLVGERRAPARVIGVRDFDHQSVDLVRLESGELPAPGELLADVQDANVGVYDGRPGDTLDVVGRDGARMPFEVSGRGRSLPGGEVVQDENIIVVYAPTATVAALGGQEGYGELSLRLQDASPRAAQETAEVVRRFLSAVPGFAGFANLPAVRAPGDWPGKSDTETFAKLLGVITVLALLSALVLIANTMSTLVAEQTREIGVMRAVGARRRQVALVYLRTALLLGGLGGLVGTGLGIGLSSLLAAYFGSMFWAIDVGFGVDPLIVAVSIVVGLLAPPLAALPAIRRGLHVDLREALDASGSSLGSQGPVDRTLRRAAFLPRVVQIGLRNVGRRPRRSVATALIVALAVGNLLAVLALAAAATRTSRASWGDHLEDVEISTGGRGPFDERARDVIRSTPGVAEVEPVLKNRVELAGREAFVWAVEQEPLFRYRIVDGRWFSAGELEARERVAIVERNLAQIQGIEVGDQVSVTTAAGEAALDVVGIAANQQENGTAVFVPLTTARAFLGRPDSTSSYWVKMDSPEPAAVDRATSLLEDRLAAIGYDIRSEIRYVAERDEVAANRSLTTSIAVLGFVIILISMVGLANAITTNVLERTREIGVLRSIGARARDVRRIFTTEGMALAIVGWVLGIPLGYALARLLVWLVWEVVEVRLPVVFPLWNISVALIGTVALALGVLFFPVRRAVRFRPGEALRYA